MNKLRTLSVFVIVLSLSVACYTKKNEPSTSLKLDKGSHIVLIGNGLGSRMMNYGHFETELQLRYPDKELYIRNMCDEGNTPIFRPHPGRKSPWAFPGAEKYDSASLKVVKGGVGHFESPDQWITRLKADVIIAFFGYNRSFEGPSGIKAYKAELTAFIKHTLSINYNGIAPPQLALVSPTAFQDLSATYGTPNGKTANANLALYTAAMKEVATANNVVFVDAFTPSKAWFDSSKEELTRDGALLNDKGYKKLSPLLIDGVFGKSKSKAADKQKSVRDAVIEKNWFWANHFKIPNGVHVYGRRYSPYGPQNYPFELKKMEEMTEARDQAIWAALAGKSFDLAAADKRTSVLPEVKTNYNPQQDEKQKMKAGSPEYKYGKDAEACLTVPKGYKVGLFASEKEFPNLANPVQMSFDNKGRLWVAVMPSYPHYKAGDGKPNDKLLILEDTNGDGKADKETVFADKLHLPIGFEFAPEGVYLTQSPHVMLLKDTDGDDKADVREIVLSGFDDHDTHHAIGAYCADPSGAIFMGEGTFLFSNVETAYGPVYSSYGGFFRYSPQRRHLERVARLSIPNPWGIAFDKWGQNFFAVTSGSTVHWMMPSTNKVAYGVFAPKSENLIEDKHKVRPTSGLEFVSSRHFPDDVQGDLLINNNIGFLGTKQHKIQDDGTGYASSWRQDLLTSTDGNFRPVDMEFAPDGSLYVIDWHNMLIGHMQHNARDPLRDHAHGRVYRITYPSRPLVKPAKIHGASIEELCENLTLPEYRTRYRTRRELRGHKASAVLPALKKWAAGLSKTDARFEQNLLEALWVSWGLNQTDASLLNQALSAKDHKVRAAAVRVLRYSTHLIPNHADLLMKAAQDEHGRVRLEAFTAASWLDKEIGLPIVEEAGKKELDKWMIESHKSAKGYLNGVIPKATQKIKVPKWIKDKNDKKLFIKGSEIYEREGHCGTCHQLNGNGLEAAMFPPLAGTKWVTESEERLIKISLNGLLGPIEVKGKKYPGVVPMTGFGGILNDEDLAAVLTYVRNSFGNKASVIKPAKVKEVREASKAKAGFYAPAELLKAHPHKK